jgi:WW domain-binding protein 11
MGRRTTKGGRILNPADAYRKKLRKKEIKKNKVQRKKVRDLILATKNPDKIRQQINDINRLEATGKAEKRHKAKKKQLLETLEKVLARQREMEKGEGENPNDQSLEDPSREKEPKLIEKDEMIPEQAYFPHPPPNFVPPNFPPLVPPRFRAPGGFPIEEPFLGPVDLPLPGPPPPPPGPFPAPPASPHPSDLPAPPPGPPPDENPQDFDEAVPPPPKPEDNPPPPPPPLPNDLPQSDPGFIGAPRVPFFHPSHQYQYGASFQPPFIPPVYYGPPPPFPQQNMGKQPRMETVPLQPIEPVATPNSNLRTAPIRKFAGVPTSLKMRRNGSAPIISQQTQSRRINMSGSISDFSTQSETIQDDTDFEKYMEEMKALGAC